MFYGLSNYLKKILPKQLFYRSLIIVAAPIIIMQITISIVFFDSLCVHSSHIFESYDKSKILKSYFEELQPKYDKRKSFDN